MQARHQRPASLATSIDGWASKLLVLLALGPLGAGCGAFQGQPTDVAGVGKPDRCSAPMDPDSPSLAGEAPAWVTFDRASLGPENSAPASNDPIGVLVVLAKDVPTARLSVVAQSGQRLVLVPLDANGQALPGAAMTELELHRDRAHADRVSVWVVRVAVRFAGPGCYEARFQGLEVGERRIQIRID